MYFMVGLPCVLPQPCEPGLKRGAVGILPLKIRNLRPSSQSGVRSKRGAGVSVCAFRLLEGRWGTPAPRLLSFPQSEGADSGDILS